jgi:short-subunit dehydrogenase
MGGTALAVSGDVTDGEDQQRLIDAALQRFGRIDALVNNAGVPLPDGFADSSLDDLRRQWDTNVTSLIELTKRALPALQQTQGTVINVGSLAGNFSLPGWGLYYPTKVAVRSVSDALRRELKPRGVSVSLVEPGPFQTEFAHRARMRQPQLFGLRPEPVARAIVRLIERPRRLTVLPRWLWLPSAIGAAIVRLLPGVVDLAIAFYVKRQGRSERGDTVAA